MKKKLIYSMVVALGLLVAGCSAATSYQAKNYSGEGFADYRLTDDCFVVSFRANEYTDSEDVKRYALRRAAEVTTNHGYRYFTVLSEKDLSRNQVVKNKQEYKNEDALETKREPTIWELASDAAYLLNGKKVNRKESNGRSTTRVYESQFPAIELSIRCYNNKQSEDVIDAYRFLSYNASS